MDILTPKGQKTYQQEKEAIEIWSRHFPDYSYAETPKNKPSLVDGILINKSGVICGVVETKCRVSMSIEDFDYEYDCLWLVTLEKVLKAVEVAKGLCVPFYGFLYFPRETTLLAERIYEPKEGFRVGMKVINSKTQATVNGGAIWRDNAYIDMSAAKRLI
jgi:hypothetical protein